MAGPNVTFKYAYNPVVTCYKSGGLQPEKPFIKRLSAFINLNTLISSAIGDYIMNSQKVKDYINNDFSSLTQYEITSFNTIFNNSYLVIGNQNYTIKSILLSYLKYSTANYNIYTGIEHLYGQYTGHSLLDILNITNFFPMYFKICLFPIKTIVKFSLINLSNNFLNMATFNANLLFSDNNSIIGYKRYGHNSLYLYASNNPLIKSWEDSKISATINSNAELKSLNEYITDEYYNIITNMSELSTKKQIILNTVLVINTNNSLFIKTTSLPDNPPQLINIDYYIYYRTLNASNQLFTLQNIFLSSYINKNTIFDILYVIQTDCSKSYKKTNRIIPPSSLIDAAGSGIYLVSSMNILALKYYNDIDADKNILYFINNKYINYSPYKHQRIYTTELQQITLSYSFYYMNTLKYLTIDDCYKYQLFDDLFYYSSNDSFIKVNNLDNISNIYTYKLYALNATNTNLLSISDDPKFEININLYKTYLIYKTILNFISNYMKKINLLSYNYNSNIIDTSDISYPLNKNILETNNYGNYISSCIDFENTSISLQLIIKYTYGNFFKIDSTYYFNIPYIKNVINSLDSLSSNETNILSSINLMYSNFIGNNIYYSIFKDNNYNTTSYNSINKMSSNGFTILNTLDYFIPEYNYFNNISQIGSNFNITYKNYLYLDGIVDITKKTGEIGSDIDIFIKSNIDSEWTKITTILSTTYVSAFCTELLNIILNNKATYNYLKLIQSSHEYIFTNFQNKFLTYVYDDNNYSNKNIFAYTDITINFNNSTTDAKRFCTNYNKIYYYLYNKINRSIGILSGLNTTAGLLSYDNLLNSTTYINNCISVSAYNTNYQNIQEIFNETIESLNNGNYTKDTLIKIINYCFKNSPVLTYNISGGIELPSKFNTNIHDFSFENNIKF